jgi:hypothetical protein
MNISVPRNAGTPNAEIRAIQEAVVSASIWVAPLRQQFSRVIVGQQHLVDRLMIGLLPTVIFCLRVSLVWARPWR